MKGNAVEQVVLGSQLVAAPVAEALILGAVDRVGLGQRLTGDLLEVEVRCCDASAFTFRFNDGGIELSDSSGARIESNNASGTTGTGIAIDGASLNNLVTRNAAGSNGGAGIEVVATAPAGQGTLIDRNTAMSNGDDGILVEGSGHTIVANTAHLNGEWGIYSNGANVDGGGNLAAGNVEPAQCFGVVCDDGDFVPPGLPETTILEKPSDPTGSRRASFTFIGEDDTTLLENLEFQCRLDSSDENDWVDCENPQEYSSLAPATHTFEVRALDESEFLDPTPARYTWTYVPLPPGVAPDTQITRGPPAATPLFEAIFQFQSNEPDARFQCKMDDGPWQACADDPEMVSANLFAHVHEFEDTEVGPHSFQVRAIDLEGLVDPTPAVHDWTITGLLTTILSGPAFEPGEGGDPPSGGETESRTATFDFAANVSDATFECSLDLGPFLPCAAPVTYTGLAVGDHIFRIIATDPEGEMVEVEPVEYDWTVIPGADDSPPETTIIRGPPDGSSDTTFEFAGQDDQTGPNQLTFECRLDSTSDLDWYECLSPHNLLEEIPPEEFAPGAHLFEVRANDDPETPGTTNPEGNPDPTPARYAWTSVADATAPETTLLVTPPTPTLEPDIEIEFAGSDNATPLEQVTFECSLDGGPWEPCDSPHSVQGVEPGEHTVRVRAVDLALNVDPTPISFTWGLIGPPETTIDSAPPAVSGSPLATFEFSSDQPGSTFECSLNGAPMEPCSSPITYDVGGGGGYSFEVEATNAQGLVDETPALHEWTVDAGPDVTPPDTAILTGPPLITTSIDATFTFFASQFGSTFECQLDGEGFGDCTSPHLLTGLEAGVHVFEVRAVDPAHNVDPTPALYTWTIDGPPVVEILSGPEEEIETTSATFTFESSDEGSTFECWLDGVIEPCESPKTWSGLSLGEHIFAVRATDPAGHVSEWEEWEFAVVPGAPPETSLTAGPASETTSRSAAFQFASSEEGSTFECSLDGAAFAACDSPVELTGLAFGDHTFEVRATDAAGNTDPTPADFAWTILDADALDTTISFGPPDATVEAEAAFAFSANAGDATFECSLDGAAFAPCTSPAEYSDLPPGEHVFEVRALASAGNAEATPARRAWTIVGPPVTTFQSAPPVLTGETDARFEFAADQPDSTYLCSLDGAEPTPCTSPVEFVDVGGGTHTYEVEATNSFGLVEEIPAIHEWTVDAGPETTPPETAISGAPPARTGSPDAVFEFTGTDNVTGPLELAFECSLDGGAFASCSSPHEVQDLEPGEHTLAVRAVEQAGNVDPTPATHAWIVEDVTAPETAIDSGPEDPTQQTSATFQLSSDDAHATFECSLDGAPFAACESPHQVSGLELGDHRFDVRARDAAGNADATPDSWVWTVEGPPDTTPPVTEILSGPAATTIETTATFSLSADEAVDGFECSLDGGPFAECESPHELAGLSLGEHTLRVRAIDLADNVDPTPAEYAWTIVAPPPPPETSIDSAPPSPQADSHATFTFSSVRLARPSSARSTARSGRPAPRRTSSEGSPRGRTASRSARAARSGSSTRPPPCTSGPSGWLPTRSSPRPRPRRPSRPARSSSSRAARPHATARHRLRVLPGRCHLPVLLPTARGAAPRARRSHLQRAREGLDEHGRPDTRHLHVDRGHASRHDDRRRAGARDGEPRRELHVLLGPRRHDLRVRARPGRGPRAVRTVRVARQLHGPRARRAPAARARQGRRRDGRPDLGRGRVGDRPPDRARHAHPVRAAGRDREQQRDLRVHGERGGRELPVLARRRPVRLLRVAEDVQRPGAGRARARGAGGEAAPAGEPRAGRARVDGAGRERSRDHDPDRAARHNAADRGRVHLLVQRARRDLRVRARRSGLRRVLLAGRLLESGGRPARAARARRGRRGHRRRDARHAQLDGRGRGAARHRHHRAAVQPDHEHLRELQLRGFRRDHRTGRAPLPVPPEQPGGERLGRQLHEPAHVQRPERGHPPLRGPRARRGGQPRSHPGSARVDDPAARHHCAQHHPRLGPAAVQHHEPVRQLQLLVERGGLDLRVLARQRGLRALRVAAGLHVADGRIAPVPRARHGRGGQRGRHAGHALLDDPVRHDRAEHYARVGRAAVQLHVQRVELDVRVPRSTPGRGRRARRRTASPG